MHVSRETFRVFQVWLATAQEYDVQDDATLEMLAQWVSNAQKEARSKRVEHCF